MTPRQFYNAHPKPRVTDVAQAAGTTFANFQQIALYSGSVSAALAKRLEESSEGEMSVLEILFPGDDEEASAA